MDSDFISVEDYFERGKNFVILEKYLEAIEDLTKAIKDFPEDEFHCEKFFMAYYARGIAYKKLQKYTEAMEDFLRALHFNFDSVEVRDNLEICRQKLFGYDDYVKYKYEVEEEQKKCSTVKKIFGVESMEKLNLIWSACSNNEGWRVLEEPVGRILFDIIHADKKFIELFCKDVLKATKFLPNEIKTAKVDMGTHHFDLFIQTENQIIPIELKVFARDQDKQCYRYLQTAREFNKNVPARMYYLTIDKKTRQPSENSLNGEKILENDLNAIGDESGVILISYKDEIMNWLESCQQDLKNVGEKNFCYQLELFADIIKEHLTKK